MARARNIKPGFFTNDDLGELSPLARLGFIGLWGQADFNGNMKYKPKRLKVEVLPYDNVDFAELVGELQQAGFVEIYQVDGEDYLHVVNFRKHQRPHKNEVLRGTDIPQPVTGDDPNGTDPERNGIETEQERDENVSNPPDTGYLIPDSGYQIPESKTPSSGDDSAPSSESKPQPKDPVEYQAIVDMYNELLGDFLPEVVKLNTKRKSLMRARWKEVFGKNSRGSDLDFWRRYFLHVRRSKPLTGTKDGFNWRPGFDWLLNESNMTRVIEGEFHQGDDQRNDHLREAS
ncbi:hypothetical protein [Marinobacter sp. OP 3.4]|uniref:hypothetical protein n=1 Tax=Marinobacter sp. OP 3.4 TaxID=3076501 RepID=UPI002E1B2D8D